MNDDRDRWIDAVSNRQELDWNELERTSSKEEKAFLESLRALRQVAGLGAPLSRVDLATNDRPAGADDPASLPPAAPRRTWAHLTLLEKIGEGAYGEVHRAWDPRLSIDVAVKLIPAAFATDDEALREARMLARVRHDHVARVYGVDRVAGHVGVWMEYVDGLTLRDLARDEAPLSEDRLRDVARSLLGALGAIHEAHLLHRDLKPENILVEKSGRIVVADFGCGALRTGLGEDRRTQFAGTPRYAAPELFRGGAATPGTDLYALGVILFQLATGEFPVEAASAASLQAAHKAGRRTRLAKLRPDLSSELATSIDKALDGDPARRHRSAREWLALLSNGTTKPASGLARATLPRHRGWIAGGAAALAAAAALIWGVLGRPAPLAIDAALLRAHAGAEWAPASEVALGDRLMLTLDSPNDVFVYVINWDEQGRAYLLFPMRDSELRNPLSAGAGHRLPGPVGGEPFAWEVSSAGGREHFAVVASRDRLDEFERLARQIPEVVVEGEGTLPPAAISSVLRGVGRASAAPPSAGAPSRPDEIVEELRRRIEKDPELRKNVAIRVFSVPSTVR